MEVIKVMIDKVNVLMIVWCKWSLWEIVIRELGYAIEKMPKGKFCMDKVGIDRSEATMPPEYM